VTDAATGNAVEGAQVDFQAVAMPSAPPADHRQAEVSLAAVIGARTWSASDPGANGAQGIYYLNPYAQDGDTNPLTRAVSGGWNAVTVSKSGYDTRRFYRNHLYTSCQASTENPISAGAYPAVVSEGSFVDDALCAREDFALHATGSLYERRPDLIVDPRSVLDYQPTTCNGAPCLSVNGSYVNVGDGNLFLIARYIQPSSPGAIINTPVTQLISQTNGVFARYAIEATFNYTGDPARPHSYVSNSGRWAEVRLRRVDDAVCPSEAQASACPVVRSTLRGFSACLRDEVIFDSTYDPGNESFGGCAVSPIPDDDGLPILVQGIGAGRGFVGSPTIDVNGLAPGAYWLEVEVNPHRLLEESDYTNNISRALIQL